MRQNGCFTGIRRRNSMVNHFVFWNFQEQLSSEEKREAALKIKESLEGLKNKIDGIINVQVVIDPLDSSNRDIALISTFDSRESLRAYQEHPDHKEAGAFIKSVTCDRTCVDFEE